MSQLIVDSCGMPIVSMSQVIVDSCDMASGARRRSSSTAAAWHRGHVAGHRRPLRQVIASMPQVIVDSCGMPS
jgi:hypothetical protein